MELAGRVYDIVTHNPVEQVRNEFSRELADIKNLLYWRCVVRMAALCHDIGHLPFSHAAEKELLPSGWTHERLTAALVRSEDMCKICGEMKIQCEEERKSCRTLNFPLGKTYWPKLLSATLSVWTEWIICSAIRTIQV